jgi:uncharacterized protein (DUF305 family)
MIRALLALVLVLSGCAASSLPENTGTSAGTKEFNSNDVMFLQMMVPHHEQGLQVVRLAAARPVRPEVKLLASAIEATQSHEIGAMAGWLRSWGAPPSADPNDHAAHGGPRGLAEAELASVVNAPDAEFERRFLDLLISHQDDARQLAMMEMGGGINPEARKLADSIAKSREAQIKQMLSYR